MSEWEYSPMENIAFALQDIVNILKRIEKKMPIPNGEITTSQIWTQPTEPVEEPKQEEQKEEKPE